MKKPGARKPIVLVYDDKPEGIVRLLSSLRNWQVKSATPTDLDERDVKTAALFVMDYDLGEDENEDEFLTRYMTGVSAGETIKSYLKSQPSSKPRIFVLYSGKLDKLSTPLPSKGREHVIARGIDYHWVIAKGAKKGEWPSHNLASCVSALLEAARELPIRSNKKTSAVLLKKLLDLPNVPWSDSAWTLVEEHQPPLSEINAAKDWSLAMKWLLHSILPFPSFLIDTISLAGRLRIEPESLKDELDNKKSALFRKFKGAMYQGILADFSGPRWWRIGIEQILWDLTKGRPFEDGLIRNGLEAIVGKKLDPLELSDPVRLVDADFRLKQEFAAASNAVQVQATDWPAFVDKPWMLTADVERNPSNRELVVHGQQTKLSTREH